MNSHSNKKITKQEDNFAKWYTDVILQADLCDYGDENGSSKGTIIFRPYGCALWEQIKNELSVQFKALKIENVIFPLLINEKVFNLEKDHITGFAPECAIVTEVGNKKLNEKFIIRPTSEVLFCKHFSRIVHSYKQLPILYNQWCNVIRWEKNTRPFLRNSEFLWQEGHTAHADEISAVTFTKAIIKLYAQFVEKFLAIKVIIGKKTAHERFAGALETFTIETMMKDGQALQAGTSHYFGNKFAKIFNIKFADKLNQQKFVFQTSWGISTRLIGALIMAQSDNLGLVLPPNIAPIKIAIINLQPNDGKVCVFAKIVFDMLASKYTIIINDDNKSISFKRSETQVKGIPIYIEIGKNETEKQEIKITSRHNLKTIFTSITENITEKIELLLAEMNNDLLNTSSKNFNNNLIEITAFTQYQKEIKAHKGYIIAPFCGEFTCEAELKALTNTTSRCVPLTAYKENSKCFKCDKPESPWTYFARSY